MASIDQRILVVAPIQTVWLYVSDPALVSKWNRGAKQVSTLTTRLTGVGMRRRCVDTRGRAVVEEMTAWLDNIGYEYTVIDGPYQTFKGRLRLQPVPEGTLVNWSVEYARRGPVGGLRDALRGRRVLRGQMADSLRTLRRVIEKSGVRFDPQQHAKAAMQDDPGIVARMARMDEPTRTPKPVASLVGDDDIPDMPASPPPTSVPTSIPTYVPPAPVSLPTMTGTIRVGKALDEDTKPRPPKGLKEAAQKAEPTRIRPEEPTIQGEQMGRYHVTTVPASLVAPPRPPDPETQAIEPLPGLSTLTPRETSPGPAKESSEGVLPHEPMQAPSTPPQPIDKLDTGEMSIWDVFGIVPPSQRNKDELEAVIASLQTPPPRPATNMAALHGAQAEPHQPVKSRIAVRRLDAPIRAKVTIKVRRPG